MRSKIVFGLMFVAFGAALPSLMSAEPTVPLTRGMPYSEARDVLIDEGWQATDFPSEHCVGRSDVCGVYREADSCAVSGPCVLQFTDRSGTILSVVTIGEDDIEVDGWRLENESPVEEVIQVTHIGPVSLSGLTCLDTEEESSFVHKVCYQDSRYTHQIVLLKLKENWYQYCNVDNDTWAGLLDANSLGRYYNKQIKGRFACLAG